MPGPVVDTQAFAGAAPKAWKAGASRAVTVQTTWGCDRGASAEICQGRQNGAWAVASSDAGLTIGPPGGLRSRRQFTLASEAEARTVQHLLCSREPRAA